MDVTMNVLSTNLNFPPFLYYGQLFVLRVWISFALDIACICLLIKRKCLQLGVNFLIYVTLLTSVWLFITVLVILGNDFYSYANEMMIGFKFLSAAQALCILNCSTKKDLGYDLTTAVQICICFDAVLCSLQLIKLIVSDLHFRIGGRFWFLLGNRDLHIGITCTLIYDIHCIWIYSSICCMLYITVYCCALWAL